MLQRNNRFVRERPTAFLRRRLRNFALERRSFIPFAPPISALRTERCDAGTASRWEVSNIFLLKGSDAIDFQPRLSIHHMSISVYVNLG